MDSIKQYFRRVFGQKTPLELALEELTSAERSKLEAESGLEYAIAMVDYHNSRIQRLRAYVTSETRS